jgi:hypothetical protein
VTVTQSTAFWHGMAEASPKLSSKEGSLAGFSAPLRHHAPNHVTPTP